MPIKIQPHILDKGRDYLDRQMSHGAAPEKSFYADGILGDLQRNQIDPYGHKGISTPNHALRKRKYGVQDPVFRGAYDAPISGLSFNPIGAIVDQGLRTFGVEMPSWMQGRAGDYIPPTAAIESATIAGQNYREGDIAGAIGHGSMAAADAAATSLGIGAASRVAGFAPSANIADDIASAGIYAASGGAPVMGNSMMIYPGAKTWDRESSKLFDEAIDTGLDPRKAGQASGTYKTPDGRKYQLREDPVSVSPMASPDEGELLRNSVDRQIASDYYDKRAESGAMPWAEFQSSNADLIADKTKAQAREYEYSMKYGNTQLGSVGGALENSAVLKNYPALRNTDLIRHRTPVDNYNGYYKPGEMMISGDDAMQVEMARHEPEHMVQHHVGAPRGGNVGEMRGYQGDLSTRIKGINESLSRTSKMKDDALARGDKESAIEYDMDYKYLMDKRGDLALHAQADPFDLYQALRGEREARYAQKGLTGDEMAMFGMEDYAAAEARRTGIPDIFLQQNEKMTAGSGDIVQGAAKGPDEVPTAVMTRRGKSNQDQIASQEKNVSDYRIKYPPSAGWKPFNVKYSTNKDGNLQWNPTSDSGFDYHLDPTTNKPYSGAGLDTKTREMSDGMVKDYEDVFAAAGAGDQRAIETLDALEWYNKVRERNRDYFGASGQVFGEFQGATSKNTGLPENMKMADELFTRFTKGDFQPAIEALSKHLGEGGTIKTFNPRPYIRKLENNKLFGMHTNDVLNVMLDNFRTQLAGSPAKIRNYTGNWTGSSNKATIDMWAARTAQRLSGRGRVVPAHSAVTGINKPTTPGQTMVEAKRLNAQGIEVPMASSDGYGMAETAMGQAVEKLKAKYPDRFANITADDFQAFEWINEKDIWDKNGWAKADLEANAIDILDKQPRNLYRSSISPTNDVTPNNQIQRDMMQGLERGVGGPGVSSVTRPTQGRYAGDPELAIANETYAPSDWDPSRLVSNVAEEAHIRNQIDAMLSRRTGIDDPNARPGFEAFYDQDQSASIRPQIESVMQRHGINASTDLQGPARNIPVEGPQPHVLDQSVGVQSMYSPEIDMRYGEELSPGITVKAVMETPELINLVSKTQRKKYKKIVEEIQQLKGVHFAKQYEYDTLHMGEGMHGGRETYSGILNNPVVGPPSPASVFGARGMADRLRYGLLSR